MPINIVIADDHAMVRQGFKQLLELDDNIKVIAEANDGYECLNIINKTNPDIILLDINMPNLNGIETLKIMRQQSIDKKVIMLTVSKEVDHLIDALDNQCNGYVLKDSEFEMLHNAIYEVYNGGMYIEPSINTLLNSSLAKRDVDKAMIDELTKREIDVLKLVSRGMLNKEIAASLDISERTVKNHISSIFKKINVSDRTQAAVFAIKNGIVDII